MELLVTRDGEVDYELTPKPPTIAEQALSHVAGSISRFSGELVLQAELAIADRVNGSHLRQTRNELLRIKRIEDMATKAGLVAVNHE